jgi:hypothetical protein
MGSRCKWLETLSKIICSSCHFSVDVGERFAYSRIMTTTQEMQIAYRHGKAHAGQDMMDIAYSPDGEHWAYWMDDPVLRLFWHAGYYEALAPRWVEAERYGDLPEAGVSRNHADNRAEAGVSVARLIDESDDYTWMMGAWGDGSAYTRPVRRVAGWLHYDRGSDGEPLLVGAVEVHCG